MSQRTVIVLIVALVALLFLVTLGDRSPSGSTAGATFVPELAGAINDVERVTISAAGNETVATLERRPAGWVVMEKGGYAADVAKLRQGLVALSEARVLEQKTSNPELYARLGVEDVAGAEAQSLAIAFTAANRMLPSVILGNAEGERYRYARRAGEAASYLLDRNPDLPRAATQWLDTAIVDVSPERVREVTITHPDGEVVRVAKAEASAANYDVADVPAGRELSYPGVANVIGGALRDLTLEDVVAATTPAPEGQPIVVEVRTFDGLVLEIQGLRREDEGWVTLTARAEAPAAPAPAADAGAAAASPADPAAEAAAINARVGGWRYRIASFKFDQLTRRMSDLLKPPA